MNINLNIAIPDECLHYLESTARIRKISKARLIRRAFQIVLRDQLFLSILDDEATPCNDKPCKRNRKKKVQSQAQYV